MWFIDIKNSKEEIYAFLLQVICYTKRSFKTRRLILKLGQIQVFSDKNCSQTEEYAYIRN